MATSKLQKTGAALAAGATLLGGGTVAENAAFERANQYEVREERVANERIEIRDRLTDAEVTLHRWDGEEALTIKRAKDQTNVPFARLMNGSRKERTVAKTTTVDGVEAFEFDIELTERPDTNVFTYELERWEDLDFFYQPELTAEEIEQGVERPENVVGSYAVYHKEKKNHVVGETNYGTGKLYHIYRPLVCDAEGNEVWGQLHYEEGELSVMVPQEFLDSAVYPVIVDPTFGYTSVGGTSVNETDWISGSFATLTEDGSITGLSFYYSPSANNALARGAIYSGTYSGLTREAQTVQIAVPIGGAWREATFSSPVSLTAGTYTLVYNSQFVSGSVQRRYDTVSNQAVAYYDEWVSSYSFPSSFTPEPWNRDRRYSIYATYTASEPEPSDSCTPPASGTWAIDLADNCSIVDTLIYDRGLTCSGEGSLTIESGGVIRVASSSCPLIDVKMGGRFINGI